MEKRRILLVDDDLEVLKSLEHLLKKQGYEVTAVNDSLEALNLIEKSFFDLVITDVRMPNQDGIKTIRKIKEYQEKKGNEKSEFMVITGYADDDAPKESALLGISSFVIKPFDADVFLKAVEDCLKGKDANLVKEKLPEEKVDLKDFESVRKVAFSEGCFIYEKTVLLRDTNLMGNTYFANYVIWQGEAREACLLSHPRFSEEMNKIRHIKMITHSLYHRFVQESTFGDVIQIKITAREIKSCSFVMVFRYYNKKTMAFLGEGWQRVAFVDQTTGNFVPIPDLILQLAYMVNEDSRREKFSRKEIKK